MSIPINEFYVKCSVETMLGSQPGPFWKITWAYVSPVFILASVSLYALLASMFLIVFYALIRSFSSALWWTLLSWTRRITPTQHGPFKSVGF